MNRHLPDVSWAGPLLRAQQKLNDAGELLERRRVSDALDLLSSVMHEVTLAAELILVDPNLAGRDLDRGLGHEPPGPAGLGSARE